MIDWISIQGFRGIRDLPRTELGQVNLIIGKNDVSKTALLEAIATIEAPFLALSVFGGLQLLRVGQEVATTDFDGFWLPLFHNLDPKAPIRLDAQSSGEKVFVEAVATETAISGQAGFVKPWEIEAIAASGDRLLKTHARLSGNRVQFDEPGFGQNSWYWHAASALDRASTSSNLLKGLSEIIADSKESELVSLLRVVEPRLTSVSILAPAGHASIHVGIDGVARKLPLSVMGQGFQRVLELATTVIRPGTTALFIDEVENGLHRATLQAFWDWVKAVAKRRSLQVFATTHSEECVTAAARSFDSGDSGAFRVIRLDRLADGALHAQSYSARQVLNAESLGVEIRG